MVKQVTLTDFSGADLQLIYAALDNFESDTFILASKMARTEDEKEQVRLVLQRTGELKKKFQCALMEGAAE